MPVEKRALQARHKALGDDALFRAELALFSSTDYLSIVLLYLARQALVVLREKVPFVGSPLALMDSSGT
jgi:hypothetical protein